MPGFDFANLLHKYGEDNIRSIIDLLQAHDKQASKKLIQSLAHKVNLDAKNLTYDIEFLAIEYEKYVRGGRRAGAKLPPKKPIQDWMKFKGIPLAYTVPIQKAIAEKGIPPFEFIEIIFDDKNIKNLTAMITELLQVEITQTLTTEKL